MNKFDNFLFTGYILDAPIPELIKRRRTKRAATNQPFRIWPLGEIPYVIDKKLSSGESIYFSVASKH